MKSYVCNMCGTPCLYDGRCGDGPVLLCECRKRGYWIDDRGGRVFVSDAKPVESADSDGNDY